VEQVPGASLARVTADEPFLRCAAGTDVASVCAGLVDDLHDRWGLPSVYLLIDGRLRCQASRGYFQVSDGFTPSTGVIGRVVSSGVGEVVRDAAADPAFIAAIPGVSGEACMPVRVFDEVVGAVNLESAGPMEAAAVADAERAAAFLGRRLESLGGLPQPSLAERVARIAVDLASETGLDRVRQRAVSGAQEISGMSSAALVSLTGTDWRVTYAAGPLAAVMTSWDAPVLGLLSGWVQDKTSSYFPPGEVVPAGYEFLTRELRALSVQPLVVAGQVAGLLITADEQPAAHDPTRTTAMELLAAQTASMLAMTRSMQALAERAVRDPLTGLLNRRGLFEHLDTAADRQGCALVLLDLDGFKAVNDRFGHARGDAVLRKVARRLSSAAREADVAFRLGGDEFAVVLHDVTSPADAAALGGRLVAAATLPVGAGLRVGASAGIRLLAGESASSALVDADTALYAAKHAGRGHAVLWEPALRSDDAHRAYRDSSSA
jgi:diguanylate cyclase (GGDEF)-like protein